MTNEYPIAVGYTTSLFKGDLVQMDTDGSIIRVAAGNVDNLGVFAGCAYDDPQGNHKFSAYWPGTASCTNIKAHVYDDPNIIFTLQSDATGWAAVDVGACYDVSTYAAGSTRTGVSIMTADIASVATTGTSLRLLRLVDNGVNVAGPYSVGEVLIIEHVMRVVVAGAGGI